MMAKHSYAPENGEIGAINVREAIKTDAVSSTRMPHKIVADGLLDIGHDVQYNLPPQHSLKRMVQKARKNPKLALACHRNMISFFIQVNLL